MSTTVSPEQIKKGWIVCITAALFFFYEFIQLNCFNAIDMQLMQTFHLNAEQVGNLSAMYFYANLIFLFPAGILLDRFSTRKLLLMATSLCVLGTFIFATAKIAAIAAVGRFIVGGSSAFCFLSCIRLATRWFPSHKVAFVTGIIVTMAMLGGMVAQTPMAILSGYLGWRHAMFCNVAFGILIVITIGLVVQDWPSGSQITAQQDKAKLKALGLWKSWRLAFGNRYNWYCGIYTSLMNLPVFLLGALWGMHFLIRVHNLTSVQASYATTLFFVGVIFGSPTFGWVSDHIGRRRRPMLVGTLISMLVILTLMYVPNLSLHMLIFLFFLIGFVTSSQVLSYPLIAELNPSAITSTAVSIASICIMIGGSVFQPLFGYLMDLHWDGTIINNVPIYAARDFAMAMWIMPIGFVVSLVLALLVRETFCRPQQV